MKQFVLPEIIVVSSSFQRKMYEKSLKLTFTKEKPKLHSKNIKFYIQKALKTLFLQVFWKFWACTGLNPSEIFWTYCLTSSFYNHTEFTGLDDFTSSLNVSESIFCSLIYQMIWTKFVFEIFAILCWKNDEMGKLWEFFSPKLLMGS